VTQLPGSLIENYQTELGLCALIWRKNRCEYALHRNKDLAQAPRYRPRHPNLTLERRCTANLTIINDGGHGDH